MQVWIVCFVVFFVAAELYQWLQGMTLPLPVWIIAGALLAVASNARLFYEQTAQREAAFQPVQQPVESDISVAVSSPPTALPQTQVNTPPRYYPGVQLPNLVPQSERSVSSVARKSKPVNEAGDLRES